MAQVAWQVTGDYFETCSCAYLCPCITSNMAAPPSNGECFVALAFHVDQGRYGGTALDGLNFAVIAHTPGPMGEGHWARRHRGRAGYPGAARRARRHSQRPGRRPDVCAGAARGASAGRGGPVDHLQEGRDEALAL